MENLERLNLFGGIYKGKRVFLTGHTGFKGSWLALWLKEMGADVIGFSLESPTNPSHFKLLNLGITSIIGDIRNRDLLNKTIAEIQPEIVFHLAAQALVRPSYSNPIETFETNIMGTINLFEACRKTKSIKAIVNVTSDKAYENKEWGARGYQESDPMGGHDPYSASKGAVELVTNCYRNSFFKEQGILLASCRAGNVIGGGDWADYRLVPDIVKAIAKKEELIIRNPNSTRPWQHVLEPLSGYLAIGQKLLEQNDTFAEGWNFGPSSSDSVTVEELFLKIKNYWKALNFSIDQSPKQPHEAKYLSLDISKANHKLNWFPVWDLNTNLSLTMNWYKKFYEEGKIISEENLSEYVRAAKSKGLTWAN